MINTKALAYIFLLGALWGPSFFFIKIALEGGIPPLSLAFMRVCIAALFLWLFVGLTRASLPKSLMIYLHAAVTAIFALALPFCLFNFAEQYIDSALAGIINGLTPIATALLAHLLIHDEKLNYRSIIGIILGVIGFVLLLLPTVSEEQINYNFISIIAAGCAALSYAVAIVYGRIFLRDTRTLTLPAVQVSFASMYLLPLALSVEGLSFVPHITQSALVSVVMLAFLGTACAFIVYFHILQHYGAIALGTSIFLLPIFSIFFGVLFLDEHLSWMVYAGSACILLGMRWVHSS